VATKRGRQRGHVCGLDRPRADIQIGFCAHLQHEFVGQPLEGRAEALSCEDLPCALRLVGQSAQHRGQTNDPSMVYVITGSFFIASEAKAYFASCGQIGPS
jgi:hypothetical protein